MVREELGPRGIWGRVHGVVLVQEVTRSGLVCDTPSVRSADAREARFLVECYVINDYAMIIVKRKPQLNNFVVWIQMLHTEFVLVQSVTHRIHSHV